MNYQQFRKIPNYEKMNSQMKVIAAIYLNDKKNQGLTHEQIKAILKTDVDEVELERQIDAMEAIAGTLEPTTKKVKGKYTQAFKLSEDIRVEAERLMRALSFMACVTEDDATDK